MPQDAEATADSAQIAAAAAATGTSSSKLARLKIIFNEFAEPNKKLNKSQRKSIKGTMQIRTCMHARTHAYSAFNCAICCEGALHVPWLVGRQLYS